jgi:hypothetical protein
LLSIFEKGRIEIDDNAAENNMRPVAFGRKTRLHVGNEKVGPELSALASGVETCKRHGIDAWAYLLDILPRMAVIRNSLTPHGDHRLAARAKQKLPYRYQWERRQLDDRL